MTALVYIFLSYHLIKGKLSWKIVILTCETKYEITMCLYSFVADNAHLACQKMNKSLSFVNDISGSEMKQKSRHI